MEQLPATMGKQVPASRRRWSLPGRVRIDPRQVGAGRYPKQADQFNDQSFH
jgi:hypothetical protein